MLKEKIKSLCKEKGLTIQRLEIETGLSNGTISKWDKAKPKAESLEKVANYLGVTIDFLLGRSTPARYRDIPNIIDLDSSAFDKALEDAMEDKPQNERQLRRQLSNKAYSLLEQMDTEQQKTAIRLLEALTDENKE